MKNFYDFNAEDWDRARRSSWGEFEFARQLLDFKKILDAGCGNGRLNFWFAKNNFAGDYLGVDSSKNLIALARKNFPDRKFEIQDLLELQKPDCADAVFCVAVLHHLHSFAEQKKVVQNLFQGLCPGGRIFLTVWNLWQPRFWRFHLAQKFSRNLKIPFAQKGSRQVHAFRKNELKKILATAGFKNIKIFYARHSKKSNFLRGRNLIVLAEK
jgi:SAM-dependent methyltransferase